MEETFLWASYNLGWQELKAFIFLMKYLIPIACLKLFAQFFAFHSAHSSWGIVYCVLQMQPDSWLS